MSAELQPHVGGTRRESLTALIERIEALAAANGTAPHICVGAVLDVIGRRA